MASKLAPLALGVCTLSFTLGAAPALATPVAGRIAIPPIYHKRLPARAERHGVRLQARVNTLEAQRKKALGGLVDVDRRIHYGEAHGQPTMKWLLEQLPPSAKKGLAVPPEVVPNPSGWFANSTMRNPATANNYAAFRAALHERLAPDNFGALGRTQKAVNAIRWALIKHRDARFAERYDDWKAKTEAMTSEDLFGKVVKMATRINDHSFDKKFPEHDAGSAGGSTRASHETLFTSSSSNSSWSAQFKALQFDTHNFRFRVSSAEGVLPRAMLPERARIYLEYLVKIQQIGRVLGQRARRQDAPEFDKDAAAAVSDWINHSQMTVLQKAKYERGETAVTLEANRALSDALHKFGHTGMISPALGKLLERLQTQSEDDVSNGTGDDIVD